MRKKIVTILIAISAIINIFAAAFIFLDLQVMQAPDTTISMKIIDINSDDATIESKIDISNPNGFDIIVRDLIVTTSAPNGDIISSLRIDGKNIPANENKTFIKTSIVNYNGYSPEILISKVSGVVGMKVGFIEKTLPISVTVISDMKEILSNIIPPTMGVQVSFGEITQENVNITIGVESYNPNTFDLKINDIVIDMKNETGGSVGNLILPSILLAADTKININGSGALRIEALNAKVLTTNITANVSATIASYEKSLEINIESKIIVPDLSTLLPSKVPTETVIRGDYHASIFGLVGEITFETHNPNNIEFAVKDIQIIVYRIDRNTKRMISEGTIEDGIIKANNITYMKGKVVLPYRKLYIPPLGGKFIPDWLEVTIRANVTIRGLSNYFWVGMVAYQDVHPLKKDRVYKSPEEVEWF